MTTAIDQILGMAQHAPEAPDSFDLAPVSLRLEDYSGIRILFEVWRSLGISDIRSYLAEDRNRVIACSELIKFVKVNRRTLSLFEADSQDHLVQNLRIIFRDDMLDAHVGELAQLWDNQNLFSSHTVNYKLSGRRLDIQLSGRIMPGFENDWRRVLVSIEDVTQRETTYRQLAASESYARGLFERSPVSLWVEDFSGVKTLIDEVRLSGITNFSLFADLHPEFIARCRSKICRIDVNSQTLLMYNANSKSMLFENINNIFRDDMIFAFKEQLVDLWNHKNSHQREVVTYALDGSELNVHMQFSIFPAHETNWDLVLMSMTDITARKKAEAYLEYIGTHDVVTGLYNRSFYVHTLERLQRLLVFPVAVDRRSPSETGCRYLRGVRLDTGTG